MDTHSRATFASLLKEYRAAQRLSQEALAERAGLSRRLSICSSADGGIPPAATP
jgi:DNA-binding XRE family transcriptional regulator